MIFEVVKNDYFRVLRRQRIEQRHGGTRSADYYRQAAETGPELPGA